MANVLTTDERRDFSRIPLQRSAMLDAAGTRTPCELVDVSLCGALLRVAGGTLASVGERCTVLVRLGDGVSTARETVPVIRMNGEIAHQDGDSVGVRCSDLDLDSIAHLRRLLEMNLGEDRMVERELVALVTARRG